MTSFTQFFQQKRGDVRKQRKAIQEALENGPSTVTKLASMLDFPKDLIVWNMMGLMRWGVVEVAGEENHELIYGLKEV